VTNTFETRLAAWSGLDDDELGRTLGGGRKGIEKECLRVSESGELSMRAHPEALGSALTNEYITTDFSEALLEFVTPAFEHTWEALRALCDIHQFTYRNLADELLWPASMPCLIPDDDRIPLAYYGESNVGTMKTVYRRGLGYRYGRHMQTIAGVHFNYSLPDAFWPACADMLGDGGALDDFRSARYMGLVRNFHRVGWLLLYLFGASPALCRSFTGDRELDMPVLHGSTYYEPFGTSLRMSDLGYTNRSQSQINICMNSVDEYIRDLSAAIRTPDPDYARIGVQVDGEWRQLNTNRLQIENEYYSSIRPKRVARSGERPTAALRRGGVEYVEVRSLDINVFDPCGINQNTMRFVEAFLIYCLLEDSPPFADGSLDACRRNQALVAKQGRRPGLTLERGGAGITLAAWAGEVFDGVIGVAELLDRAESGDSYRAAVRTLQERVAEPDATPSARILADLSSGGAGFFRFAMDAAISHRNYFLAVEDLPGDRMDALAAEAMASLARQRDIEAADTLLFEDYLARYFGRD